MIAFRTLAFAFLAIALVAPAQALEPEQREVVIVSGRVWEGHEFQEIFLPSTKDEMTLMAGEDSALVYVRTLEYYWPLARQVYVDLERQRDVIEGELVIRKGDAVMSREPMQPYAILYPEGAVKGGGSLLWGEEAERAYAEYQEGERRFARDFARAQQAHSAYEQRLLESGAARKPGEPAEHIAPPPPLPQPSLRLVTQPTPAFRLVLAPGAYAMTLEEAGQAVPGTERRLRVVDRSGSAVLVADIVPAERWTRPLASNTGDARVFAKPGTVFYLTLAEADRFDEADYLPVVSPQAEPVAGRPMWVRRGPSDVDRLQADWNGEAPKTLSRQPLKVEQTSGSAFGYRVRAARDGETPDLDAFTVEVPSDPSVTRGSLVLDTQAGAPFAREVVVVHPRRAALGLALAILPLTASLAFLLWRRMRHQTNGTRQ
jgi:hypothetical protein